jgi:hypothetical protein
MLMQAISICGAILILSAFGAQQMKRLHADTVTYQLLNVLGGPASPPPPSPAPSSASSSWKGPGR